MELDSSCPRDRNKMKELMSKHHYHKLINNYSASETNYFGHSLSSKIKFIAMC